MGFMFALNIAETQSQNLGLGGEVFGIGVLTVFAVLILIWGFISLFSRFFGKKSVEPESSEVSSTETVATQPNADQEIIAVIAAAIAMAESESSGAKFRVVSFKRK